MGRNLVDKRLATSLVVGLMVLAACGKGSPPASVMPPPPFEGMERPKDVVALVVIGEVAEVTYVLESSPPDAPGFCYYNATVTVERTIFGPTSNTITIRQAVNSLPSWVGIRFGDAKRKLKEGDRIVAILSRDTSLFDYVFDLNEDQFVSRNVFWVQGQEVANFIPFGGATSTGKCMVYTSQRYERETQPLEEVVAWLEEYSQVVLSIGD